MNKGQIWLLFVVLAGYRNDEKHYGGATCVVFDRNNDKFEAGYFSGFRKLKSFK